MQLVTELAEANKSKLAWTMFLLDHPNVILSIPWSREYLNSGLNPFDHYEFVTAFICSSSVGVLEGYWSDVVGKGFY